MDIKVIFRYSSAESAERSDIVSFGFFKEIYTPYTSLTVKLHCGNEDFSDASAVSLVINGKTVHNGLIDSIRHSFSNSCGFVTIVSRGFTSLLMQNQLQPGLITDISFNSLMENYYTFPEITHENNNSKSYIYVKSGSSIWDGAVNLSYKLCGTYPFIFGTNCVRITPQSAPVSFSYGSDEIIESGCSLSSKRLLSNLHMSDINGDYGTYTLENSSALERGIIRHHFFELDKQFLYEPQQALEYRMKFAQRGFMRRFCRYSGFKGEDLNDFAIFGSNASAERICAVKISGNSKGIFTEISAYSDGFRDR